MPDAAAAPKLVYRGGRRLAAMSYKLVYYGPAWNQAPGATSTNPHADARTRIDAAVAAAMQDAGLNTIMAQYFPGQTVTTTVLPSVVWDKDQRPDPIIVPFHEGDVRRIIPAIVAAGLDGADPASTAINIVLPHGFGLQALGLDAQQRPPGAVVMPGVPDDAPSSGTGLAGYHGSVTVGNQQVPYSVVVWSDGSTGIPVPGWAGWENICATLYHELQEIRTNPDVDVAVRTGSNAHIGWNTDPLKGPDGLDCREIGDMALILFDDWRSEAFQRVRIGAMDVPIQRMWCNQSGALKP